jgi:predicted amidohydrolase
VAAVADEFGCVIVYGTAHRDTDGRQFNAAYVIGPDGALLGASCKGFLWHFDRRWFAAAADTQPIDTPIGRLGVLICADGRIPTIAHTLAQRGAELLVMPTAWVTSGRDPANLENVQADLMIRARARENGLPLVAANKCGVEASSVAYCGKSAIVDAGGRVLAQAAQDAETIVRGEVAPGAARPARARPVPAFAVQFAEPAVRRFALAAATARTPAAELAARAAQADACGMFAAAGAEAPIEVLAARDAVAAAEIGGIRVLLLGEDDLLDPAAFIEARLAGVDLFCVRAARDDDWSVTFARTRAAELRAYVVTIGAGRSFACDPDGAVIAGTFGGFECASFVYDGNRTRSGLVAPGTDVFDGMREQARRMRSGTTAR